jgi:hypothetical protein
MEIASELLPCVNLDGQCQGCTDLQCASHESTAKAATTRMTEIEANTFSATAIAFHELSF